MPAPTPARAIVDKPAPISLAAIKTIIIKKNKPKEKS
jgi:hypothetical protein